MQRNKLQIIAVASALGLFLFGQVVFASEGAIAQSDGRLLFIRILQVLWTLSLITGGGLALWSFFQRRKSEDDLLESARYQKLMLVGIIVFCISLFLLLMTSLTAWIFGLSDTKASQKSQIPTAHNTFFLPLALSSYEKITSHVPARNEKNVARSTSIVFSTSEALDVRSIVSDDATLSVQSIVLQELSSAGVPGMTLPGKAAVSADGTIVTVTPINPFGEEGKKSMVRVTLSKNILTSRQTPLLSDANGYSWEFEVSGLLDTSPPQVETFLPRYSSGAVLERAAPNALIQIGFTESLDPLSFDPDFISVMDETHNRAVEGVVVPGNRFRTMTFIPREECSKNSCGEPMYCLPKTSALRVTVKAAERDLKGPPDSSKAAYPFTGIIDLAGNALDGGGERGSGRNGKADGSPTDDFSARFMTTHDLDLRQPTILSIGPARDAVRVIPTTPIEIVFSKMMDLSSVHTANILVRPGINYSLTPRHDFHTLQTKIIIDHDPFQESTVYSPEIRSDIRDASQNCFSQCLGPR